MPDIFSERSANVSAHLVVRRDGCITQCVPFNVVAWHAGRSQWISRNGTRFAGLNSNSIGIEIENWGPLHRSGGSWVSWTGAGVDGSKVIEAGHKFGVPDGAGRSLPMFRLQRSCPPRFWGRMI
ncbi:MAG: N-acetylmuramoyl-L-alanine amidase [Phyllobacterium sp.]|uniref:N-acetylmuramoyl-L-alanine amidase n=1 Tax=Phyllobacterium sp. TaxID=1871046 RepID=UPI0030F1E81B